jgi:hypothetical protein
MSWNGASAKWRDRPGFGVGGSGFGTPSNPSLGFTKGIWGMKNYKELARLRLRPTRRVQLSAVSYQRSAASRNRKGSVCQPTSEPRPMLCLYRSCLHKPASASPRESPALMRHNGPRSARYFGLGRALQGNRRPLGPCVAARHWPRGGHTRGVHAKGDVYAISKT